MVFSEVHISAGLSKGFGFALEEITKKCQPLEAAADVVVSFLLFRLWLKYLLDLIKMEMTNTRVFTSYSTVEGSMSTWERKVLVGTSM